MSENLAELRVHLQRAEDIAAGLVDLGVGPRARGKFFGATLTDALDRVSEHNGRLTVIVGAGASIEAGLPSWPQLVRALLDDVAAEIAEGVRQEWVDQIESEGLLPAAAVVKALRPDDREFRDLLRRSLYGKRPAASYLPQALAQQIAWMKRELGATVTLATGNYDGLLERALTDLGIEAHSYVRWRQEPPNSAAVYHLHGRLMTGYSATGHLVLSEDDYAQVQHPGSWQERFMREALESSLCIFVGLSMTDPNLIRWLYRYGAQTPSDLRHLALFVRQAAPDIGTPLRTELEKATRARWARCGVDAVWADFFAESAQFMHELGLRVGERRLPNFHTRAAAHRKAVISVMAPGSKKMFQRRQEEVSAVLSDMLDGVRELADAAGVELADEHLGLGMWVANHDAGSVACWVTADRLLNDQDAFVDNYLEYASPWIAVEAITRGVVVQDDPAVFASRWRLVRGVPIVVEAEDGAGRTIVGAMTLTSMTPHRDSALSRAPRGLLGAVDRLLSSPVAHLFR
ncbi:MAG: SIR2 family protein [Actinomycetota bacterium]|nr:SIR2 family protein [Actinomycetota bacterium]